MNALLNNDSCLANDLQSVGLAISLIGNFPNLAKGSLADNLLEVKSLSFVYKIKGFFTLFDLLLSVSAKALCSHLYLSFI
jgi:hypothetical protein